MEAELTNPLLWVFGSLALAAVVTNLAWLAVRGRRPARDRPSASRWTILEPVIWLLWALFLFVPPIAAWWAGALSPYLMGLSELDWIGTMTSGGLIAAAIVGIMIFGWLIYRHSQPRRPRQRGQVHSWLAPVEAALLQWHWAFYRAGAIGGLILAARATTNSPVPLVAAVLREPFYWGSWIGLVLVAVEWALDPFARGTLAAARENRTHAPAAERTVIRMALAVTTTALFVLTRNFWLPLVCHVIVETAVTAFLTVPDLAKAE
jgi:hypothetical protein